MECLAVPVAGLGTTDCSLKLERPGPIHGGVGKNLQTEGRRLQVFPACRQRVFAKISPSAFSAFARWECHPAELSCPSSRVGFLPIVSGNFRRGGYMCLVSTRATPPGGESRASLDDDVSRGRETENGSCADDSGLASDVVKSPEIAVGAGAIGTTNAASNMFIVVQEPRDSKVGVDYLGESTKGDMNFKGSGVAIEEEKAQLIGSRPIEEVAREEMESAEHLLEDLNIPAYFPHGLATRGIFCSRTLNLRSITTIGYDMDYTLIHYNVNAWEGRAYEYGMSNLRAKGYPVDGLHFDPELVIRGLIMDKENGNLVKADRFGYVKRALHGKEMLSNRAISDLYGRELVDLRNEGRWEFLNTLFSVSEAVMYMQMVERLDEGLIPPELGPLNYQELYKVVAKALFRAHVEGQLKAEIINEPEKFVELDPELPLTLLDQKEAGKKLLLITNSDYHYTNKMMQHAFDRFLPEGMRWRDLFHMVIVSARKPEFFQKSHPLYEIVTEDGLMRPCFQASPGGLYCGGSAQMVEAALGCQGDETMYVGDHIYTDVSQSKLHLRWRTCLVLREIEEEVEALAYGGDFRRQLLKLMTQKEVIGDVFNQLRLKLQRTSAGRANLSTKLGEAEITEHMQKLLVLMERLDEKIASMLLADGEYFNKRWGYLSRAGINDKSHLTRQIEKYADIYTSRVSNFLRYTPFMYFRSHSQSLAHDRSASWPEGRIPEQPTNGAVPAATATTNGSTNNSSNGTVNAPLRENGTTITGEPAHSSLSHQTGQS